MSEHTTPAMEENHTSSFKTPTADELQSWMIEQTAPIKCLMYPRTYISRVDEKRRHLHRFITRFTIQRADGSPPIRLDLSKALFHRLRMSYTPVLYTLNTNSTTLLLELGNELMNSYAIAFMSSRRNLHIDGIQYLCQRISNELKTYDEALYYFPHTINIARFHLHINIYSLPLHLRTMKAIERMLQPYCIVTYFNESNLMLNELRGIVCAGWNAQGNTAFPHYIVIHVRSRRDGPVGSQHRTHKKIMTYCVALRVRTLNPNPYPGATETTETKKYTFVEASALGSVKYSYLNDVDVDFQTMRLLESSYLLSVPLSSPVQNETQILEQLHDMHILNTVQPRLKFLDRRTCLINATVLSLSLMQKSILKDSAKEIHVGPYCIRKWSKSVKATPGELTRRLDVRLQGLPNRYYSTIIMEDILSPYCMLDDNGYDVGSSPNLLGYECTVWTKANQEMPDLITTWVTPDGCVFQPAQMTGLQLRLHRYKTEVYVTSRDYEVPSPEVYSACAVVPALNN